MSEPEQQLRFVGRLQATHDAVHWVIKELPTPDMHTLDLLVIARDAMNKAIIRYWGQVPEIAEVIEHPPEQQPAEPK